MHISSTQMKIFGTEKGELHSKALNFEAENFTEMSISNIFIAHKLAEID